MKWFRFEQEGRERIGVESDGHRYDVTTQAYTDSLLEVITRGFEMDVDLDIAPLITEDVRLLAPYVPMRNVICVGKNYADHIKEMDTAGAGKFVLFTKAPSAIVGPFDSIERHADLTNQLDYEGELAIIIGTTGRDLTPENALDHVFGYSIVNDVTARDLQKEHVQFFRGKSLDGFCPFGPVIVTKDTFDPTDVLVETRVNGQVRQSGSTKLMIRDIVTILTEVSRGMTLEAGDIIATGTPAGVGHGMKPPVYLQTGDIVDVSIEGIGHLRNEVKV
ncbi:MULTISPECIES: fumarylacetoacetate hydrolase family protein [unclassified Exiguobacterium]|uniref:fumarylacetoacetate hydrolase family protein n=1 Tax=unclassified Exiguobacterium TaxID=2644629 RepID=UPI001BE5EBED|nr:MULTISPECIES: fumarylacetoacetate hydrolase family protein [unclassified Exiguobacterium]